MAENSILVLGGTGKTGRRVAKRLRDRGLTVKAASRSGQTYFDWHDEDTWEAALEGATAVYLVDSGGEGAVARLRAFSDLAAHKGARRLVLLSARRQESGDKGLELKEQAVKDSGTSWTILRPTWFAQNFSETPMMHMPLLAGELALPAGDGTEPFIDVEDIAEVAVAALTEPGHTGQTYDLSGPEALTFGQAVSIIAEACGRELRYHAISGEEYVAHPQKYFTVRPAAENYVHLLWFIAAGQTGELSEGVQRALGREPNSFVNFASRAALNEAWNPPDDNW